MTDPQQYGVRHFLRQMDPEGASERRRRLVPLLNGQPLEKGAYADLDQFRLDGILVYKTLVLPHSPVESRPPSIYQLVRSGRYYDVWQRPDTYPTILEHLPLGDSLQPGAVPRCSDVLRLAQRAGPGGRLAAAPRSPVTAVTLSSARYPGAWSADANGALYPHGSGDLLAAVDVSRRGGYVFWVGGSFRDRLRAYVDGRPVADLRYYANAGGAYTRLGRVVLAPGRHLVLLRVGGPDLHPGSGGYPFGMGPLLMSTTTAAGPPVTFVNPNTARSLCGKRGAAAIRSAWDLY